MSKVIIFDFDGVIVYSMDLSFSLNREISPNLVYKDWKKIFEGNVYNSNVPEAIDPELEEKFWSKYHLGLLNLLPIEEMDEIVKDLAKEHILIIVSSAEERTINAFLEKHDLQKCFKEILGKETHKSKVEKFNLILDKYMLKPEETLIVTDTIGDILEAHEAGIKSLGVIWGVHNHDELENHNPHFIAIKPQDILVGIKQLLG